MAIYRAGTLLIPSGPSHDPDRKHLHVVCNDTDKNGFVLIVPIASWTNELCDNTCGLLPHDHAFIRRRSWVVYRKASIITAEKLEQGVKSLLVSRHDKMNAAAFLRIKNGICQSSQTPRKIKKYFDAQGE